MDKSKKMWIGIACIAVCGILGFVIPKGIISLGLIMFNTKKLSALNVIVLLPLIINLLIYILYYQKAVSLKSRSSNVMGALTAKYMIAAICLSVLSVVAGGTIFVLWDESIPILIITILVNIIADVLAFGKNSPF